MRPVTMSCIACAYPLRLIPTDPKKSLDYYYTVRSNAAHRGRPAYDDLSRVSDCLSGLFRHWPSMR
jgi:hypothetical protein